MNLKDASSILSCYHMTMLAKQERENDINKLYRILNTPNEYTNQTHGEYTTHEQKIQRGVKIDKYSCIYKRPVFQSGDWEKQFEKVAFDQSIFNIQTKKR